MTEGHDPIRDLGQLVNDLKEAKKEYARLEEKSMDYFNRLGLVASALRRQRAVRPSVDTSFGIETNPGSTLIQRIDYPSFSELVDHITEFNEVATKLEILRAKWDKEQP